MMSSVQGSSRPVPGSARRASITRALGDCLEGSAGGPDDAAAGGDATRKRTRGRRRRASLVSRTTASGSFTASTTACRRRRPDSLLRFYRSFVSHEQIRYETQVATPAMASRRTTREGHATRRLRHTSMTATTTRREKCSASCTTDLREPDVTLRASSSPSGRAATSRRQLTSLESEGFLFLPSDCAGGAPCRLHIAFHGCRQGSGFVGRTFARLAGYNRWADDNRIVVLYPQAAKSMAWPLNPNGCWDWWGYSGANYAARDGAQLSVIHRMLKALGAT